MPRTQQPHKIQFPDFFFLNIFTTQPLLLVWAGRLVQPKQAVWCGVVCKTCELTLAKSYFAYCNQTEILSNATKHKGSQLVIYSL